jgi:hypothetical protein
MVTTPRVTDAYVMLHRALARLADTLQCERRHPGSILAPTVFPCSAWEWATAPQFKKKWISVYVCLLLLVNLSHG